MPALSCRRAAEAFFLSLCKSYACSQAFNVQDTAFTNVTANNTFWETGNNLILTDGLLGVEDSVFSLPAGTDRPAAPISDLDSWPSRVPPPIQLDDLWITTAQQVRLSPSLSLKLRREVCTSLAHLHRRCFKAFVCSPQRKLLVDIHVHAHLRAAIVC